MPLKSGAVRLIWGAALRLSATAQRWADRRVQRWLAFILLGLSAVIVVRWAYKLVAVMPSVSLADFVLAMWQRSHQIEEGRYGEVILRAFEPFGGHIVAYTRFLQLLNFVAFDLSPLFVKIAALATLALAIAAYAWMVFRIYRLTLAGAALLLFGVWLICSPVIYVLISWPDSIPPYYSVFIVLCLGLPGVCSQLESPTVGVVWRWILVLAFAFAVIIGSGVGWAIIPTLVATYALARGWLDAVLTRKGGGWFVIAALAGLIAVAFIARELVLFIMERYEAAYFLDEAVHGIAAMFSRPAIIVQYFLATLATNFVLGSIFNTWPVGAVVFAYWLILVGLLVFQSRTRSATLWLSFSIFGLLSVLATTVTRWHFVEGRGLINPGQYYSVFALPFHIGVAGLSLDVIRSQSRKIAAAVAVAVAAMISFAVFSLAARSKVYDVVLRERAELSQAAIFGARNWNLKLASELAGSPGFVERYMFKILPDFKRMGKYRAITDGLVTDPAMFAKQNSIPQPLDTRSTSVADGSTCRDIPSSGRVVHVAQDLRQRWAWLGYHAGPVRFVRFVGYSTDPLNCQTPAEFVFALDPEGKLLCVARPGAENRLTVPPPWRPKSEAYAASVFDFSCPLRGSQIREANGPFTVIALFENNRRLIRLVNDDTPLDRIAMRGKLLTAEGQTIVNVNGAQIPLLDLRAGWMDRQAGRIDGDFVVLDGWAFDRKRQKAAQAILAFADDELVYAAAPTVPVLQFERNLALTDNQHVGFVLWIPKAQLWRADGKSRSVRIFALTAEGEASELFYGETFPFREAH